MSRATRYRKAQEDIHSLENEIEHLNIRKKELENELEIVDQAIDDKKSEISNIQYDLENE